MDLKITELSEHEVPLIANYWLSASAEYLKSMGADIEKLPRKDDFENMLLAQLSKPLEKRRAYVLIWWHDNKPVGHCNVTPFSYGDSGTMHLHLWNGTNRKKGIGTILVRKSVRHFFDVLKLKNLHSEPYALNPAPNRTLEKAGFIFEKTYTTIPGSINFEQEVNRWKANSSSF